LFSPPNVRGWPGGDAWINTNTLLARKQFLERALSGSANGKFAVETPMDASMTDSVKADDLPRRRRQMLEQTVSVRIDSEAWLARAGLAPERTVAPGGRGKLEEALLAVPATAPMREGSLGLDALRAVLLDPAYQLK
jgi:hypothetical protein